MTTTALQPDALAVLKSFDFTRRAIDIEARSVTFCITTGAIDRDGDTIDPQGWDVADFMKSPVILWAHNYDEPPIARALDVKLTMDGLESTAQFPIKGIYPFADMVFDLIAGGFISTSSVGFQPIEAERAADRDGINFKRQSLLEWSIVPVPSNPQALIVARSKGINLEPMVAWARKVLTDYSQTKGVSPKDVSLSKAPEDEAWSAPSLGDLLSGSWDDATDAQKRKVAGHFAWAAAMPPAIFGDCKLPHHNASGSIVWRGVAAAAARMNQASIPSGDMGAVKNHLARHYRAFSKPVPWESSAWAEYEQCRGTREQCVRELARLGFADEAHALQAMADAPSAKLRRAVAKQDAGAVLSALLTALDDHIDAADDIVDAVLLNLGIPDVDEGEEPASRDEMPLPSSQPVLTEVMAVARKRGRVLSAANEGKIRTAKEQLESVLAQLDKQPPPGAGDGGADEDDEKGAALLQRDAAGDGLAIRFAEEPDERETIVIRVLPDDDALASREDITAAVQTIAREALGSLRSAVVAETQAALARARGRVD